MNRFNKKVILWTTRIFIVMFVMLAHTSFTPAEQKIFLEDIGVCTRFENAAMLAAPGYTFIEVDCTGSCTDARVWVSGSARSLTI